MKFRLTLVAILISAFAFCQDLEGRWVNSGFGGEENLAYDFSKDQFVKMYYAGKEIATKEPIKYELKNYGDSFLIEMSYTIARDNRNVNVIGLVTFLGKDQLEMEFWSKSDIREKVEFTEESLIYTRQ